MDRMQPLLIYPIYTRIRKHNHKNMRINNTITGNNKTSNTETSGSAIDTKHNTTTIKNNNIKNNTAHSIKSIFS